LAATLPAPTAAVSSAGRVLVADDEPALRRFLSFVLKQHVTTFERRATAQG